MITIHDPLPDEAPSRRPSTVCVCGHSTSVHNYVASRGRYRCKGGRGSCQCTEQRSVLEVPDARLFMFGVGEASTEGHPLVNGMRRTIKQGKGDRLRWLEGAGLCEVGGCTAGMVTAVFLDRGERSELRCMEHAA